MELAERMQKTKLGQATWANPDLGKTCLDCAHLSPAPKPKGHATHICTLVRVVSGIKGVPYDAARSIACSKFAVVDKTTNGE